jgi:membrane associated rhomboid family serine protease
MLEQRPQLGGFFRKPPKQVTWFLLALLFIWITFALALNWGGADKGLFLLFAGDSEAVLHGQIWRLLTAALLHTPGGNGAVMHIGFSLLILYFFMPTLQERWGSKRLFLFLGGCAVFAYAMATLGYLIAGIDRAWYGGMILGDACVVAWAVVARNEKAMFWFIIPMKPMVMVYVMIGWHVLSIIAVSVGPEGLVAPFAAMAGGYLFGETSPLRRYWLKLKLKRLQNEVDSLTRNKKGKSGKRAASHLRVIPGGANDDDDDRVLH